MENNNSQMSRGYAVDVVFCIDATNSMSDIIDNVKYMASCFNSKVHETLKECKIDLEELRVKVITFRNFKFDSDALASSPFYTLPENNAEFLAYINEIRAVGGCNGPNNGLEALVEAMNSEWTNEGRSRRQIIVLFTDRSAIHLGDSYKRHRQYPENIPSDLDELHNWWKEGTPNGYLQWNAKRLILCTPNVYPWSKIDCWGYVLCEPEICKKSNNDFTEALMEIILSLIVKDYVFLDL